MDMTTVDVQAAKATSTDEVTAPKPKPPRKPRPNYAQIHSKPLPIDTFPLPAFVPHNPLSLLRIAYALLAEILTRPNSHCSVTGYYSTATRSVHITDSKEIRLLWERGFFGKGSLSRSEPEWLERERQRRFGTGEVNGSVNVSSNITAARRAERKDIKRERARLEREEIEKQLAKEGKMITLSENLSRASNRSEDVITPEQSINGDDSIARAGSSLQKASSRNASVNDARSHKPSQPTLQEQEHLQLIPQEAFFLSYGLGILTVLSEPSGTPLSTNDLFQLFRRTSTFPPKPIQQKLEPDDPFILNYVVFHHYRSQGWVVRPGIKFSVDWLLYNRGPAFSHAEFAVLVVPSYREDGNAESNQKEWWWIYAVNRVQNQVRKSMLLAYVDIPRAQDVEDITDINALLRSYNVTDMVLKRWTPNRNRD